MIKYFNIQILLKLNIKIKTDITISFARFIKIIEFFSIILNIIKDINSIKNQCLQIIIIYNKNNIWISNYRHFINLWISFYKILFFSYKLY